jgi:hypothetical protein
MALNNLFQDDLKTSNWLGKVIDNQDPDFEGKIKVRIFGKFDDVLDEDLPWARPLNMVTGGSSTGSGFHSVPKVDSVVGISFDNGDMYEPEYFYHQHISDELKAEIEGSYTNAHSIIYDTEAQPGPIKIFFTEETGLMLDYNGSQINIRPDNTVFIQHSGGKVIHVQQDSISIGKENESDEPAVLGNKNVDALNALADQINNLAIAVQTYATAQATVCGAIFPLAPLSAALTALGTAAQPVITQIAAPIKAATIPQTRSSSVSIDGPSQL